ncbi:competence type IV pilus major pilin ComGC [Alkaliphilus hydrothermalis]|uniref:Type II secretion system protein G n=1 Tax=Alkaliphilus hydrothermalis TaxID=1482730 RepID=A0ABS2NM18_9FIRM|nr:prepilin-type N-terminal cleavage/methylation domain-containing protein [Alkaliphilus hydrothermalis]MBM7613981.1 type II secretion system protein G [Alkaliphilus hydrothermalis]
MMKIFRKRLNNRKGFTLIELIVVIAILGILAAIAVPRLGGFRDTAQTQAEATNVKVIESAVAIYHAANGSYPANVAALTQYLEADIINQYTNYVIDQNTGKVTPPAS